jgi:uroporphyrinogen-III decarboxylase
MNTIKIRYPEKRIEENKRRFEDTWNFRQTDRAPVLFATYERYYLDARGVGFNELYANSRDMLHHMILNQAWAIEHVPDDRVTDRVLHIPGPWFDNVLHAEAFGAEVVFYDNQPPRIQHFLSSPEDVERLDVPAPTQGLWGRKVEYFKEWHDLLEGYEVYFNDEPGKIEIDPLDMGGDGPVLTAVDLAGENFYSWLYDCPEICHLLLDKLTRASMERGIYLRELDPRPRPTYLIADDFAELMSAQMYRDFIVPYDNKLYDLFGRNIRDGRSFHNCGNSTHLLDCFVDDLNITSFMIYGHPVDPQIVAEKMGGRVYVWGNISCMKLLSDDSGELYDDAVHCLQAFDRYGGFCLGDGANVAPGTPIENLEKVFNAACDYGTYPRNGGHR